MNAKINKNKLSNKQRAFLVGNWLLSYLGSHVGTIIRLDGTNRGTMDQSLLWKSTLVVCYF